MFALLSKYYGLSVANIKALTVYQYRSYLDSIAEVAGLLDGRPNKNEVTDEETHQEKLLTEDLLQICRENKIRIPNV